ncbi:MULTISPECIES: DNA polymerase III subunit gamma/tau [Priestia]|uniref:DNA-directed DNA polymerase n=3 Tax=Priestia TaxID=2800373 RepID=D5DUS5_PRIM1|nr:MULTISPECIES: DNA polymerase III subunit gamma/tau [Priestia]KOP77189.1 DNA polymerase III subunit gamma/tau [Bacillus sp. FJAT-21351]KQU15905.1 DNA polymerase III subunit gamma/tau [Bacillus sp. Leaf75]KRF51136.1 DNA polymerase III subunit gamma/tau [Bacillus sp. Soil531]MCF6800429.1 DNA polymerase III subunit gamma/tau [Bacillus sp. ET1]MCJ7984033.1 DNA polymerase III subunit gamma/tau [Priestia sp. OVL9]MDH6651706.1 DNA polymerase-3 subunit gamma/tau [Bacillus sp. PvP124]MDP9580613.1 D
MAYQALYRVYRPQSFNDVVGQQHIIKTLQNALVQEKFSHAYLFSGPRGTGKTTAAKILAKAVNCEKAPIAEPCNECATCRGITDGSISDVIEIDAASNNGVDEIRDIRDKVKYAPSAVRYKVYIIDEVHMLSIGAFNALLKTLEEPPAHVIFILATTEPHKIPLTIISRCQRFDFKRISPEDIVYRMKEVLGSEELEVSEDALYEIAKASEGGMRDALSLLDQAISYSTEKVSLEDVLSITGAVSQAFIVKIVQAIFNENIVEALDSVESLIKNGKDPARFVEDLIFYYRDVLLYQASEENAYLLEKAAVNEEFKELSSKMDSAFIYKVIAELNQTQQEMKWSNHPRVLLEVALVKLAQSSTNQEDTLPYQDILQKMNQMEAELQQLKEKGIQVDHTAQAAQTEKKQTRQSRSQYKTPVGKVNEVLKNATRQNLETIKRSWAQVLDTLKQQNKASHAALLSNSEPVASSDQSFILKFKYEIHCKMASENNNNVRDNLENILYTLIGSKREMVAIPESEWDKVREEFLQGQQSDGSSGQPQEEDPVVAEAKKLFGEDLIEIQE